MITTKNIELTMRQNNKNSTWNIGLNDVYPFSPFFSDNVYQWIAQTDRDSIIDTLIQADYMTLQEVRRSLPNSICDPESNDFQALMFMGTIMTHNYDKWHSVVVAFICLSGDQNVRNAFLTQYRPVQVPRERHMWVDGEELSEEVDNKGQGNAQKQASAKSDTATTANTESKSDPKGVSRVGQAAHTLQGYRYVSYENSAFQPKAAPKISWRQWFGQKTVWLMKAVFTISNSLAIRRAVLSGLVRTALQMWAAQIVAFSTAIAAGMVIWKALNWVQERIAPTKSVASRVGEQIAATILGVNKVNKELNIRIHVTQVEHLSYALDDQTKKVDAFGEQLDKQFAESKERMPEAEQRQVKMFIDKKKNLYSFAF